MKYMHVFLSRGPALSAPVTELVPDAGELYCDTLADVERKYIIRVFRETGGVVSAAAARLGMPRTTLNGMMLKLGITRDNL